MAPKYVIKAKDLRLQKITVAEHSFFFPGRSSAQQAAETEEGRDEGEEQVIELNQSEDEFGAFDQLDLSEDPLGDIGDPNLAKEDLQRTSSQADMGFKRKPSTSLLNLIEGWSGKDVPGKSQPKLPHPPSKFQPPQTRSSSALPPPAKLPHPLFNLLTPRGRGLPKGKNPWTGRDPILLRRRIRASGPRSN